MNVSLRHAPKAASSQPSPAGPPATAHQRKGWAALPLLMPGMRVGLLGGSFNPAHDGHRHISLVARRRLGLDKVLWLVSPQNPLKSSSDMAPLESRLAQAGATARHPKIEVTQIETVLGTRYTADTLRALKRRYPGVHFVWIMGADNLVQLPRWRQWQTIMALMPVAIVDRPGHALKAQLGRAAAHFRAARWPEAAAASFARSKPPSWIYLHAKLNPISSTQIRAGKHRDPETDPVKDNPRSAHHRILQPG